MGIDNLLRYFLPRLFFRKPRSPTPLIGALITVLVKKFGLGLKNPVTSTDEKYLSLQSASMELNQDVIGEGCFSTDNHLLELREEIQDEKIWDDANDSKLKGLVDDLEAPDLRLILCAKNTGSWLSMRGTTVTGKVLAAT